MTARDDPFRAWDASYVLGALDPQDRRRYEEHLLGCAECSRAVHELAGLPGLLARVPVSDVSGAPPQQRPAPVSLLPELARQVGRERRRARARRTAAAAALVAASVAVSVTATLALTPGSRAGTGPAGTGTPGASGSPGEPMTALKASGVAASTRLQEVAWGTRIDLTCSYAAAPQASSAPGDPAGRRTYVLVVLARDGGLQQVATWARTDGPSRLQAATALAPGQIAAIEVRTAAGHALLRQSF